MSALHMVTAVVSERLSRKEGAKSPDGALNSVEIIKLEFTEFNSQSVQNLKWVSASCSGPSFSRLFMLLDNMLAITM